MYVLYIYLYSSCVHPPVAGRLSGVIIYLPSELDWTSHWECLSAGWVPASSPWSLLSLSQVSGVTTLLLLFFFLPRGLLGWVAAPPGREVTRCPE